MPEFWELDDAALWGEVDAAWLLEQFRRNEISEERAHRQALFDAQPEFHLRRLVEQMVPAFALMAEQMVEHMAMTVAELNACMALMAAPDPLDLTETPRPLLAPPQPRATHEEDVMPRRAPRTYEDHVALAARAFIRGTAHRCPHEAIEAGARTEEQWTAALEGAHTRFWSANGLRARRAVTRRHPMQAITAGEVQLDSN